MSPFATRAAQTIFGVCAADEKARLFIRVGGSVIALDFMTKALALLMLSEGHLISAIGDAIQLDLCFNATPFGSMQRAWLSRMGPATMLGTWLAGAMLCAVALPFASAEKSVWRKIGLFATIVVIVEVVSAPLGAATYAFLGGARAMYAARTFAFASSSLLVLRLMRGRAFFVLMVVIVSASLANVVNHVVNPGGVIDFVYIRALGDSRGIVNVADLTMDGASLLLVALVPLSLVVAVARRAMLGRAGTMLTWVDARLA